jgi:phage shock protein PspC (stress-responsive transcriptional regulator)
VLSATLATLLAIEFGFTVLVAAGAALYFVAAVMLPR